MSKADNWSKNFTVAGQYTWAFCLGLFNTSKQDQENLTLVTGGGKDKLPARISKDVKRSILNEMHFERDMIYRMTLHISFLTFDLEHDL